MGDAEIDDIVSHQIAYYRARAAEYDDWWERRGKYDAGDAFRDAWFDEAERVRTWLESVEISGKVLEVAAGTGNWTPHLVSPNTRVTALDAAPEALQICSSKVAAGSVSFVVADVFAWTPPTKYDVIFFAFWMSHIPPPQWQGFWHTMADALSPEGRLVFIENAHPAHAFANGPANWPAVTGFESAEDALRETRQVRHLADGTSFTVEKHHWSPQSLRRSLAQLGWSAEINQTTFAFMHGVLSPPRADRDGARS